jgi:RNA polymerase sigma-70 factor, ECF subfamily
MTEPSDEELLVAIASGPGAITEFYRRHVACVTGMAVRRFDNPEDVADFVATVFLEVLTSAGSFDPVRGRAVAWLYGLGGNVAIAMFRQRSRAAQAEQRVSGRALLDADDYARVEERIDAAAEFRRAYVAMRELAEPDRKLLELVAIDGLSTREAAAAVGLSPVAARVRLSRARNRLRSVLGQQQHERGTSALRIAEKGLA